MCVIDLDGSEVWRETGRRARKTHRCSACGFSISPGGHYTEHFSVFEGDRFTEKICAACHTDRQEFFDAHGGGSCVPSGFPWLLKDCIAEGDEESETIWEPMLSRIMVRYENAKKA